MNNSTSITPEELLSAMRTLATVDPSKVKAEITANKGWAAVQGTLDRYVPRWRVTGPVVPEGTTGITLVGRAAYAIRTLAQNGPNGSEQKEKAEAWEKIVAVLDQRAPGWRAVNGTRLDDRAIAAVCNMAFKASALADPKTAIGAWKKTAETLDAVVPGWYPGGNACIATHAANAITELKNKAANPVPESAGDLSAWVRIVCALNEIDPHWNNTQRNAVENVMGSIRALGEKARAYDELMATLDTHAPGWGESSNHHITRAQMAAHTISEAFKSTKADKEVEPAQGGTVEFRLVKGGHVPNEIVDALMQAAQPCLYPSGSSFALPKAPTPQQWATYKTAVEQLRVAMQGSPSKVVIARKTAEETGLPFGTSIGKLAYVRGWNHLLAEVATQHIVNLQTPSNLTDDQCESIYEALHRYGQEINMNNFGLPKWLDGSHRTVAYKRIRQALSSPRASTVGAASRSTARQ